MTEVSWAPDVCPIPLSIVGPAPIEDAKYGLGTKSNDMMIDDQHYLCSQSIVASGYLVNEFDEFFHAELYNFLHEGIGEGWIWKIQWKECSC